MSKKKNIQSKVIQDDRFKSVHFDPKFTDTGKNEHKVKIDNRFAGVFTDDRFKVVGKTDKYGREFKQNDKKDKKDKKSAKNKEMDEYYYQEEEGDDENKDQDNDESESEEQLEYDSNEVDQLDQDDDDEEQIEEQALKPSKKNNVKEQKNDKKVQQQQKENKKGDFKKKDLFKDGKFEWNEESSSEEEIEQEIEEDDEDVWGGALGGAQLEQQQDEEEQNQKKNKNAVQYSQDVSSILALQNFDWMQVGSKELMLLFSSVCKQIGFIKQITIYPSKYGLEQLESENTHGPQGIWKKQSQKQQEKQLKIKKNRPIRSIDNKIIVKSEDQNCDIDITALRAYEQQRLKYYYAIIECDSVKTALNIYDNCNEQEFELTGIPLDLRFVPEETQFPYEPKEKCNKIPAIAEVKSKTNRAMGHTNVRLTWDEPQNDKYKFLDGKDLNDEDLDKIDWDEYFGEMSDEEEQSGDEEVILDEEEEEEQEQERIQQIKEKNKSLDWRKNFDKKHKKRGEDMEITFMSGFGDINKNMENRKKKIIDDEQQESGFEKYMRIKKEKKQAKKLAMKNAKMNDEDYFLNPEQDNDEEQDSDNEKQQQSNKSKSNGIKDFDSIQKQKKEAKLLKRKQKAELELVTNQEEAEREGRFKVNVTDDRFNKVYEQSAYALDPTNPHFDKNTSEKFLKEQQLRRRKNKKVKTSEQE